MFKVAESSGRACTMQRASKSIDHLPYIGSWKKSIQEKKGLYRLFHFRKSPYGLAVWVFTLSRYRAGGQFWTIFWDFKQPFRFRRAQI
jgi:hypothetical protein